MESSKYFLIYFVIFFTITNFVFCNVKGLPRGVPLKLAAYYQEQNKFHCDNNKEIPFEYVNDDYCDCADGTDEPGTSACLNGFFYCQNIGFRSMNIPSSRVNDFVCDCCDGSDEWNTETECPNVCDLQGKKWREEIKELQKIQSLGQAKRSELEKIGAKLFEEKQVELEKHKKQFEDLEQIKISLETKKNEIEEKERAAKEQHEREYQILREEHQKKKNEEFFEQIDTNHDSIINIVELHDFLKTIGEVKVEKIQEILEDKTELTKEMFKDFVSKIRELMETLLGSNENVASTDAPNKEKLESEDLTQSSQTLEKSDQNDIDEKDEKDEKEDLKKEGNTIDNNELPRLPYNEETQKLIEEADNARNEFNKVFNEYTNIQNNIKTNENLINFDYGSDLSWAALRDQCTELKTTQYIYRLCIFDRSVQKDLNGHSEVNLGYWNSWAGPEDNKYSAQLYNKGQLCWNGPERSTYVKIQCGAELELVEASEPSKCEYVFVLKSPSACNTLTEIHHNDEL